MLCLPRKSAAALLLCALTVWCQTVNSEFTIEDCKQLNSTVNITCTSEDAYSFTINFQNVAQFEIFISVDNNQRLNEITIRCSGTEEDILQISTNLTQFSLEHHDFGSITVDGCIPFADILTRFHIKIPNELKFRRGDSSTPLKPEHLQSLEMLPNLALNGYGQLDEHIFASMKSLQKLELTGLEAPLPGGLLSTIGEHLLELNMRGNEINELPQGYFMSLSRLESLYLSYNKFKTIRSDTFDQLHNLTTLDLSNNEIERLPATVFKSLQHLTHLYLSDNRLERLELGTFVALNNLQHLNIENNALEIASSEACKIFDGLSKLEYLQLSKNSMTVYCLPNNMSSVYVNLEQNQIGELLVPSDVGQEHPLANLNVRYNRLEHLSDAVLLYLHESLPILEMAQNPWQCDWASAMWLDYIKFNKKTILDLEELQCSVGNTIKSVNTIKSSDVGKPPDSSMYYIIALVVVGVLAALAVLMAFLYRRKALRNNGKWSCGSDGDVL